ncbi:radical SAM protein [Spirochaetia bacterium 38H-sp]|uniref:Radical SAM protein n=1 Tax=Rarispira pelagica TaxID=3141764 RepID=A0ABU9UDP5_9SPIR
MITVMLKPVSSLCNLSCQYCYYKGVHSDNVKTTDSVMLVDTVELLASQFKSAGVKKIAIGFHGGEPLIAGHEFYRQFFSIMDYSGIDCVYSIQTNATILDYDLLKLFKQNRVLVGVSIDGLKLLHDRNRRFHNGSGSYDIVKKNISLFQKEGLCVNCLTVVDDLISINIKKVYEALKKMRLRWFQFIPPLPFTTKITADEYAFFLHSLWDLYVSDIMSDNRISIRWFDAVLSRALGKTVYSCAAGGKCIITPVIEKNGDVYPCDFFCTAEWKLGNLWDTDLFSILNSNTLSAFMSFAGDKGFCNKCEVFYLCGGICYAYRDSYLCPAVRRFLIAREKQIVSLAGYIKHAFGEAIGK